MKRVLTIILFTIISLSGFSQSITLDDLISLRRSVPTSCTIFLKPKQFLFAGKMPFYNDKQEIIGEVQMYTYGYKGENGETTGLTEANADFWISKFSNDGAVQYVIKQESLGDKLENILKKDGTKNDAFYDSDCFVTQYIYKKCVFTVQHFQIVGKYIITVE